MKATRRILSLALSLGIALASVPVTSAQGRVAVTRDAEIEALVADYARPLLKAAGLRSGDVQIILVNDPSFNAFVIGRRMFVNTGALLAAETPNEIIAVLAHEIGHIAGGHQERLREQLERAKTQAIVAQIIGLGATIAGAKTGSEGLAGAGRGISLGAPEAVKRNFLAYKRTEEAAADRAAVRYLEATGQSPVGLQKTFKRFQAASAFVGSRPNPYLLSHPLPRERLSAIAALVAESPNRGRKDPAALQLRHDRARAKIAAYTAGRGSVNRLLGEASPKARQYGLAIEAFLGGRPDDGVRMMDGLVSSFPNDPYIHEMRAEMLLRGGRPGEAATSFRRALKLGSRSDGILRAQLGNALMSTDDPAKFADGIAELRRAVVADPSYAEGFRDLAKALNRIGDSAAAHLATAEAFFVQGNATQAKVFAKRAQQAYEAEGPGWRRAQDIIDAN